MYNMDENTIKIGGFVVEIESRNYRVFDYIRIPFEITPITVIIMLFLKVFVAVIPSLQVLVAASFIDTAIDIYNNGGISRIYISLFGIILLIITSWLASTILSFVKLKFNQKMNEVIRLAVIKKRSRLAYQYIENNDTWDLIARVGEDPSNNMVEGFDNLLSIMEYVVKIVSLILVLVVQVWWVAIAVFVIAVVLFKLSSICGKVDYDAFVEAEKHLRKADYLKEVISSRESVEERTLFGYTNSIDEMWFNRFETARKIQFKAMKVNFIKLKAASAITASLSMVIALVLLTPLGKDQITAGMYMSLVTASFSLVQQMSWQLSFVMQEYTKHKMYLKDFTEFSKLEEVDGADSLPDVSIQDMPFESIEFKNVYFAYPGTDRYILNGLSMKLEKGKRYAFVGKNGAGKTTITKLLTGLYDNYKGEILINGKNIRNFTGEQLKAYFSVVYQDFAKYYVSLKDNILLGNCGEIYDYDKEKALVEQALDSMEMTEDVKKLSEGIYTNIGKVSEDSVDLSGGQWQRIAIARTLISKAPICILDEPTAALDPISESRVYKLFAKISKGKSTIFITHRLGAVRIADEILVVDEGVIKERGSHEELLCKKYIYAEMFEAQRSWYNE